MANNEIKITINAKGVITGVDQVEKGFEKLEKAAKKAQASVGRGVNININQTGLGQTMKALGEFKNLVGGGLVGATFVSGIRTAINKSVEFENALMGLTSVARASGLGMESVESAARQLAADGLIPISEVAQGLKNLLSSGLGLEESIKLFKGLKDTAAFNRQSFYSLGQAVVATTEGIKNGNSVLADAVGTTENLSVMQKRYAESLGTTVDKLTDSQKSYAAYLGFLNDSVKFTGDAAKVTLTYSGAVSRLSAQFDSYLARVGKAITDTGILQSIFNKLADGFERGSPLTGAQGNIDKQLSDLRKRLTEVMDNEYTMRVNPALAAQYRQQISLLEEEKKKLEQVGAAQSKNARIAKEKKDAEDIAAKKRSAESKAADKEFEQLQKKYRDFGSTAADTLRNQRDRELEAARGDFDLKWKILQKYEQDKAKLEEDADRKRLQRLKEVERLEKSVRDSILKAAQNPFGSIQKPAALIDPKNKRDKKLSKQFDINSLAGRGIGVANNIMGGKQGAADLVGGLASGALDLITPGLGQAAGPLIQGLLQGPEAVRTMVKDFAKALPDLVEAFITAIPAFVEEVANQFPLVIERLAEKSPAIIAALVKAAPRVGLALSAAMPKVAVTFATELIKNVPRIVSEIVSGIGKAFQDIVPGGTGIPGVGGGSLGGLATLANPIGVISTGGASKVIGKIGKAFGLSVNSGGGASTPREQAQDGQSAMLIAEIRSLKDAMTRPMVVNSDVRVDNAAFAKVILTLERTNQRLRPT